ncbi:MAG: hypothetical protein ACOZIN_14520 [Myxococcota bacterium]
MIEAAPIVALLLSASPAKPFAWEMLELSAPVRQVLKSGKLEATPKGFRIIALSHLADGCAEQGVRSPKLRAAAVACVERAFELAKKEQPSKSPLAEEPQGLWLSHLNLILGARDRLGGCADAALHAAIARTLLERSLVDSTRHVASYSNQNFRWPADQAATLASLARYDRGHGTTLHAEPFLAWRQWVERHAFDDELGLPWSEATGKAKGARHPRGCAQSFSARYLAEVDPALASRWWSAYKKSYFVSLGPGVGFREWPPGVDLPADVDSGPIVVGVGAAASALAISGARAMGEEELATKLETAAELAADLVPSEVSRSSLAAAIRFQARWQPSAVR